MNDFLETYSKFIKSPITVVDVGANEFPIEGAIARLAPICEVHAAEPQKDKIKELEKKNNIIPYKKFKYYNYGLAETSGEKILNIAMDSHASSIYEPNKEILRRVRNDKNFDTKEKTSIKCITLSELLNMSSIKFVDFLNITAGANELNIIKGAGEKLKNISIINCQVEFIKVWKDQPVFDDVLSYLRRFGFRFIKFVDLHEVDGKKMWGKGIFIQEKFEDEDRLIKAGIFLIESDLFEEARWLFLDHQLNEEIYQKLFHKLIHERYGRINIILKINSIVKKITQHIKPLELIRLKIVNIIKKKKIGAGASTVSKIYPKKK